jgi:Na+/H+-dicarboxylate symporter
MANHPANSPSKVKPTGGLSLTSQIFAGLLLGGIVGWILSILPVAARQGWTDGLAVVRDVFLHLIKMMVAPLVFGSIVQGFAGAGDAKKAQRIGWKAFVYFEVVTAFALVVGLVAVNLARPGDGVVLAMDNAAGSVPAARPPTLPQIILHMFPTSLMDAMARNDVLQVVCFAVIFAVALIASGEEGRPVLAY